MKPELVEFSDGRYGVRLEKRSGNRDARFANLVDPNRVVHKPQQVRTLGAGTKEEAQAALEALAFSGDIDCEVVR